MADIAQLGYEIDSSQARTAAKDLMALNAASVKLERAAMGASKAQSQFIRNSKGQFASQAEVVARYGAEVYDLSGKYNLAMRAALDFARAEREVYRAVQLGVISAAQGQAHLDQMRAGMQQTGAAALAMGNSMRASNANVTNLMFQFQDIGMMLAAGQNPLMLAMQQGSQVVGVFKQMEGSGQSAFSAIKGGLLGMISPMSLLTIGVIAGGAALVQWGLSAIGAGTDTKNFATAVDEAQAAIDEINNVVKLYSAEGLTELKAKYGEVNAEVLALVENQRLLALAEGTEKLNAALTAISAELGQGLFATAYGELEEVFEVTANSAQILYGVIEGIGQLDSIDKQLASITALKDRLSEATDGFTNMTAEQAAMLRRLTDAEDKARQLKNQMDRATKSAEDFASIDLSSGIDAATLSAQQLAANMGIAYGQAVALMGAIGRLTSLPDERGSQRETVAGANTFQPDQPWMKTYSGGGRNDISGGGGGGGGSDPYEDNLNRLIESLRTERETVDAWYAENLAILNDRRAAEIIGEQAHKEALLDLEKEYQERKKKLTDDYSTFSIASAGNLFGELYSLSGSSYDGLLRLQRSFVAAQALIDTWGAYAKALRDGGSTPWQRFALAAKVLAAGMGAVNAIKGGGGGGASTAAATTATSAQSEPQRTTLVSLQGEDWLVSLVGPILDQVFKESQNGTRVIWDRA